jgi:hypothetical protein
VWQKQSDPEFEASAGKVREILFKKKQRKKGKDWRHGSSGRVLS